ncbi:MAG TPA: hypothetical protein VH878_09540, partial [Thermodesulfobacteriota bacterium]
MPETKTSKGVQISKIAKEVNRQSSEILDYLKRIGVEVGGIMSKVDDSVYHKILGHFKTDLEDATKHKQKLMEFKKKHKGIEIIEIEEDIKKERERKLKEEEDRLIRVKEEERVKAERDAQLQKELEEKRRLIKEKEEELERQKQQEIEQKKKQAEEAEARRKSAEVQKTGEKEPEKKKPVTAKAEEKPKKFIKPVHPEKQAFRDKKPEFRKREVHKDKGHYEAKKHVGKPEVKKRDERPADKRTPGKYEGKKPDNRFEKKKPVSKFERVTIKEDFRKPKRPEHGHGKRPFFKKPFVSKEDERRREAEKTGPVQPLSADAIAKKRDADKKDKAKKQKYIDGLENKKRKKLADEEITQ